MSQVLEQECDQHSNRFDCPDSLVYWSEQFDEYGLIVHDGGSSYVTIHYCPWCGNCLPDSKRDRWFEELETRGLDPDDPNLPEKYRSSAWYKT